MTSKSVLVVSPYYPPSTLAGVHRARHLAKHLPATGWTPIVLCVDEAQHEQMLDPALAAMASQTAEVIKVGALPKRVMRKFGIGDVGLRGWWSMRSKVRELLRTRAIDVVLITGSPFYPLRYAAMIKRDFGVPVVLDLQDPWVSAWGKARKPWTKAGASHALAAALEPGAVRAASFVTSVSDKQNAEMAARYPWLDASRMAGIPIGGDADDFAFLRAHPDAASEAPLEAGVVNLSYVGTYLPRAEPLVRRLFLALAALKASEPLIASRLRLNFIGTSNQPSDTAPARVLAVAQDVGVADLVRETPRRIPYLSAIGAMANSDGLLLIGSDEPHYTASKIYPALMSGRPFLSLFHRASSAHQLLTASGGGVALAFETPEDLAALTDPLAAALKRLAMDGASFPPADPAAYRETTAQAVAERFAAVFEAVTR